MKMKRWSKRIRDRKHRRRRGFKKMALACNIAGLICLVYFCALFMSVGISNRFNIIWLLMAIGFELVAFVLADENIYQRIPKGIYISFGMLVILGVFLLIFLEIPIITTSYSTPDKDADYVLILGGQVQGSRLSPSLKSRMDKAIEYLKDSPDSTVIVSGGQGIDEDVPEGQAMGDYLISQGVTNTIIEENKSMSTKDNMIFSSAYIDDISKNTVLIVSSDFHLYRAMRLAEKAGYGHIGCLGSSTTWFMKPTAYLREAAALLHEYLRGSI